MMWKVVLPLLAALFATESSTVPGDLQQVNPNDIYINALRFAVPEYNKESNDIYFQRLLKVVSTQQQVVEGMKYYIIAILRSTVCGKDYKYGQNCPSLRPHQSYQCLFVVWIRPGPNNMQLVESQCQKITD